MLTKIKHTLFAISFWLVIAFVWSLQSCRTEKRILTDEVHLRDGSTVVGKITKSDSTKIEIARLDHSTQILNWNLIDSVRPHNYFTPMSSMYAGLFNTPYYSVFLNEKNQPTNLGLQGRTGWAINGKRYTYLHLTLIPSQPLGIRKLGFGKEFYKRGTYMSQKCLMLGYETNLIFIKNNNAPQFSFEPAFGKHWHWKNQYNIYAKIALQINIASRNQNAGISFGVGINYLHKDFKTHYQTLNETHKLP